jgi:hypothetical protein
MKDEDLNGLKCLKLGESDIIAVFKGKKEGRSPPGPLTSAVYAAKAIPIVAMQAKSIASVR